MTGKTISVLMAAMAVGAVVWWAFPREQASLPGEVPPAGAGTPSAPEATRILPEGIATDALQLEPPPALDTPGAEPGFTIAVHANRILPTGASAPPAPATLELGLCLRRSELGEAVMVFETEADGKAQIKFPRSAVPESPDGKQQYVWLRSRGVGLLTRTDFKPVPEADDATVQMRVVVQPGAIVEGRILGPDGLPVAGQVEWWHFGDEGITSSRVGSARADGLFQGELRLEGRHGLLAAGTSLPDDERQSYLMPEQLDLGTGFSELFDVDFTEPVPFLEVHVSGPGLIRGHVRDGTGAPAAGVSMLALLAELDDETDGLRLHYPRTRDLERAGGGHLWVTASTDAEGAFAFRGLRRGLYHVRAADGDDTSSGYPILLTERAVPSDGVPLELQLSRPYLAIHVREADGSVPERAIGVHRSDRWRMFGSQEAWPEEPELLVALSPRDAHRGGWRGAIEEPVVVGPGEFVVELEDELRLAPELELDVGLLGGDLPWRPRRILVAPGAGRSDVDLVLPPAEPPGFLLLDVLDASGTALVEQVRVRIIDPATGVVLVDVPCDYTDEKDWPMRIPLPAGGHRLLVEGHPWMDDHHGTIMRHRVHGAHEQALRITAGVETRATATLGQAARLALRVIGLVTEADRAAIRARFGRDVDEEYVEFWAPFVTLRLEREGRWPEQPEFARHSMQGTSAAGTHLFSSVAFGNEETSEPLTPGDYTLVATAPGGRELARPVTLVPGQTLSVTLHFD